MSKDDYFVLVYRILTYLYACFKAGERADAAAFGPEALRIGDGYWVNLMESILNEGYVTGIAIISMAGGVESVKLMNLKITQKGIEYLQENSMMSKVKDFLREAKDIIPGI